MRFAPIGSGGGGGPVAASAVEFTPADTLTSTNVQAAIVEALEDARAYTSAFVRGLDIKQSARCATIIPLPTNTRSGNVLTASANGVLPTTATDDVAAVVGNRVVVNAEVNGVNNGIFTVTSLGSAGSPWSLTRATDMDVTAEVSSGVFVPVTDGSHGPTGWVLTTLDPITLNITALTFSELPQVQTASGVPFAPADTLTSTNVQAAIVEALEDARAYTNLMTNTVGTAKASVKVVTEWALPANTVVGNVMTANANGALPPIDGRLMSVGERLLVTKEGGAGVAHVSNGWYDVTSSGSAGTPWVLTRSVDGVQGQILPGSTMYVEHGDAGEDSSGLDIVMNQVATTASATDPQWAILRAGDIMLDCLGCNGNDLSQYVVASNGVLPVTPTIGNRYAALGPSSYARMPQLRCIGRWVASSNSGSDPCFAALRVGDITICVSQPVKIFRCTVDSQLGGSPSAGQSYITMRADAGTSAFKLVGPSQGSYFTIPSVYRYDPVWQGFRAAGDNMLVWQAPSNHGMGMYMDGPPGRYVDNDSPTVGNRVLYFQRQRATAGKRLWVLATSGPISVGTTPLLFKPVAYS